METGNIVEYIDRQKIICAVVLEIKKQRIRLLTESNREVKLSVNRLSHRCKSSLELSMGRDRMAEALKEVANRRRILTEQINIEELWEVLNSEQKWIDLQTMTEFCFPRDAVGDHESAVIRAFFQNRLYFKFNQDSFFPNSVEQVAHLRNQAAEENRKNRIIDSGGDWLRNLVSKDGKPSCETAELNEEQREFVEILKGYYLFDRDSSVSELARAMLNRAGMNDPEKLFDIFVALGIWGPDENIDIYRYEIPAEFPEKVTLAATALIRSPPGDMSSRERKDLTGLRIFTIDGQATLDFDDALSIEKLEDGYLLGVHIADVGHFVEMDSTIDREAMVRGSSIYMPDRKIPMIPPMLAEGHCSLRAGELRPAVSTMIRLSGNCDILDYEVYPSLIRVTDQLTYYDVNMMAEENRDIIILHDIASKFRRQRLDDGAVHISLPEVNVWIDENGELVVSKTNRESPGRMLVSEIMIMANWLMARFLADNGLSAIFRSQPEPRERLYKGDEGSLFQNCMQRKLLSRFILSTEPDRHSGLGLNEYLTATSPIRKYFDLVTQRQIRSLFNLNPSYRTDEIQNIIHALEQPMSCVSKLQNRRRRYWLLRYLEGKTGEKEEALVLGRRRNSYLVLLTEYMLECLLPAPSGVELKPEETTQVTIQHVNARKDVLTVFMG